MHNQEHLSPKVLEAFMWIARDYFERHGWKVEVVRHDRSNLVQVQTKDLQCGDGRYALVPHAKAGPAIFGAYWGVLTLAKERESGLPLSPEATLERIETAGFEAAIHGAIHDGHKDFFSCGFFGLLQKGKLHDVNRLDHLHELHVWRQWLRSNHVNHVLLPGEHKETIVRMSWVPGMTPKLDAHTFRLSGDLALDLSLSIPRFVSVSRQTVTQLSKVRRIQMVI